MGPTFSVPKFHPWINMIDNIKSAYITVNIADAKIIINKNFPIAVIKN